jgi:hypothetical protein
MRDTSKCRHWTFENELSVKRMGVMGVALHYVYLSSVQLY